MATAWHYQSTTASDGPVSFQALVQLVRNGDLTTGDLVREEWNDDWRPAALAVGLFHMAGREDLVEQWEAEQRRMAEEQAAARQEELESILDAAPDEEEGESVPSKEEVSKLKVTRRVSEDRSRIGFVFRPSLTRRASMAMPKPSG